jgi:hypothetical protein
MPRQSLAEEYYLETEETPEESGVEWLLLYDFREVKPSTKFWTDHKEAWRTRREILPDPVQRLPDRPEKGRGRRQEARGALRGVDGGLQGAENRAIKARNYDPYSLKSTLDIA